MSLVLTRILCESHYGVRIVRYFRSFCQSLHVSRISKSLTFPMYVYTIDRIQTFRKAYAEKYNARNTGNDTEFFHITSNKK